MDLLKINFWSLLTLDIDFFFLFLLVRWHYTWRELFHEFITWFLKYTQNNYNHGQIEELKQLILLTLGTKNPNQKENLLPWCLHPSLELAEAQAGAAGCRRLLAKRGGGRRRRGRCRGDGSRRLGRRGAIHGLLEVPHELEGQPTGVGQAGGTLGVADQVALCQEEK